MFDPLAYSLNKKAFTHKDMKSNFNCITALKIISVIKNSAYFHFI